MGEQVLDARNAGGHLDHVIEGAELEHEVLEPLGGRAQLDEHAPEGLRDFTDLVHLAEAGHRRRRRALGRRPRGRRVLLDRGGGHGDGLAEGASEVGHALREPAEEDVPEEGDGEGEEDAELRLGRFEQAEPPHEVHEDQQRQDGGQREDGARGFAELHWTLTDSRSSKGKPDDRIPSLSPSVPGAGADSKEKRLVEARRRNTPNASEKLERQK